MSIINYHCFKIYLSNNSFIKTSFNIFAVNYANGSHIDLSGNGLTVLDQGVFEPILQLLAAGGFDPTITFIDVSSSEFLSFEN